MVGRDKALTPDEFWRLHPCEVWWLIEARQKSKRETGGRSAPPSEQELEEMYEESTMTPNEYDAWWKKVKEEYRFEGRD